MNKKKVTLSILAIGLISALTIGGTLAFLTDGQKVTNTFSVTEGLDIDIDEPTWNDEAIPDDPTTEDVDESKPGDGEDLTPGDTKIKDPTVTAVEGDCYTRTVVRILDNEPTIPNPDYDPTDPDSTETIENENYGKPITDQDKLDLILATIYYDPTCTVDEDTGKGTTMGLVPENKYSTDDLEAFDSVNPYFELDDDNSKEGVYYYNYVGDKTDEDNKGILEEGETALLFTNIVIPSDWDNDTLETMGKYQIEVYAQAIQAKGFDNADDAFAALQSEIDAGTLQGEPDQG